MPIGENCFVFPFREREHKFRGKLLWELALSMDMQSAEGILIQLERPSMRMENVQLVCLLSDLHFG